MALEVSDIQVFYGDIKEPTLDIDFQIFDRGINFLIGKNGSGKSTFLKAMSNYNNEVRWHGRVLLDGKPLQIGVVGLVTQTPLLSVNLELSFLENLLLAQTNGVQHLSFLPQVTPESKKGIMQFLQRFSNYLYLKSLLYTDANKLSSGQLQLLSILMRVIRNHKLLLLDECTANLDSDNTQIIMNTLLEIAKNDTVVIFATHQLELLKTKKSRFYVVENKTIKAQS